MKKFFTIALCALAAVAFVSCTETESSIKKVESIRIYSINSTTGAFEADVTGQTFNVNEDYTKKWFGVKFTPADASDHSFTVDATNGVFVVNPIVESPIENIFSVSIYGNGTSVVTVTATDGGKQANITFNVSGKKTE